MSKFSNKSNLHLDTCHPLLQELFRAVVKEYGCAVIEGHRNRRRQNQLFQQGKSKLKWPKGKHNVMPSEAADVGPWIKDKGIPWDEPNQFYTFAEFVFRFVGVETGTGIMMSMTSGLMIWGTGNF